MKRLITASPKALVLTLLLVLVLPVAAAQAPTEPLAQKSEEKRSQALADPRAYAEKQTTEEQLAEDAAWSVAYACYVAHEAGLPDPDVSACEGYEEAVGVEEEDEDGEPIADAEELQEDVIAETEAFADDVVASVERIGDDPARALTEIGRLLDRLVQFVSRIIDVVVGAVGGVGREWDALSIDLADGLDRSLDAAAGSADQAAQAVASTLDQAAAQGKAATKALADGVGALVNALGGGSSKRTNPNEPVRDVGDASLGTTDLLDDLVCLDCLPVGT